MDMLEVLYLRVQNATVADEFDLGRKWWYDLR